MFIEAMNRNPGKVSANIRYDNTLAHEIYAASDLFLMPSLFEPCGLSQLISLRYGTLPIVRETGGLKDTVSDFKDEAGNGFTFQSYNAQDMLEAIQRAINVFSNKEEWEVLVRKALSCNNCWQGSADTYIQLYQKILGREY
jgi:starch synthase